MWVGSIVFVVEVWHESGEGGYEMSVIGGLDRESGRELVDFV